MTKTTDNGDSFPHMSAEEVKAELESATAKVVRWVNAEGEASIAISMGTKVLPPLVTLQERVGDSTINRHLPAQAISYVETYADNL